MDTNVPQGEVDHKIRQRFRMARDDENLFVRQRVCLMAQQFSAPRNGDWFRVLVRTIGYVHGAPLERESGRCVLGGWRALARRCGDRRANVRLSADAAWSRHHPGGATLRAVTIVNDGSTVCGVQSDQGTTDAVGERLLCAARHPANDAPREVTRFAVQRPADYLSWFVVQPTAMLLRIALDAVPCGRRAGAGRMRAPFALEANRGSAVRHLERCVTFSEIYR